MFVVVFSSAGDHPSDDDQLRFLDFGFCDFIGSYIQFNFIERETQYVGYASSVFRKVIIELCFFD